MQFSMKIRKQLDIMVWETLENNNHEIDFFTFKQLFIRPEFMDQIIINIWNDAVPTIKQELKS